MRLRFSFISVLGFAIAVLSLVGIGGGGVTTTYATEGPRTIEVILKDNKLPPGNLHVRAGDRIIFRNIDDHTHTANILDNHETFVDREIDPGRSILFIIPFGMPPGNYEINCTTHEDMKTTLVVDTN